MPRRCRHGADAAEARGHAAGRRVLLDRETGRRVVGATQTAGRGERRAAAVARDVGALCWVADGLAGVADLLAVGVAVRAALAGRNAVAVATGVAISIAASVAVALPRGDAVAIAVAIAAAGASWAAGHTAARTCATARTTTAAGASTSTAAAFGERGPRGHDHHGEGEHEEPICCHALPPPSVVEGGP